jgi:hypothetical protein
MLAGSALASHQKAQPPTEEKPTLLVKADEIHLL